MSNLNNTNYQDPDRENVDGFLQRDYILQGREKFRAYIKAVLDGTKISQQNHIYPNITTLNLSYGTGEYRALGYMLKTILSKHQALKRLTSKAKVSDQTDSHQESIKPLRILVISDNKRSLEESKKIWLDTIDGANSNNLQLRDYYGNENNHFLNVGKETENQNQITFSTVEKLLSDPLEETFDIVIGLNGESVFTDQMQIILDDYSERYKLEKQLSKNGLDNMEIILSSPVMSGAINTNKNGEGLPQAIFDLNLAEFLASEYGPRVDYKLITKNNISAQQISELEEEMKRISSIKDINTRKQELKKLDDKIKQKLGNFENIEDLVDDVLVRIPGHIGSAENDTNRIVIHVSSLEESNKVVSKINNIRGENIAYSFNSSNKTGSDEQVEKDFGEGKIPILVVVDKLANKKNFPSPKHVVFFRQRKSKSAFEKEIGPLMSDGAIFYDYIGNVEGLVRSHGLHTLVREIDDIIVKSKSEHKEKPRKSSLPEIIGDSENTDREVDVEGIAGAIAHQVSLGNIAQGGITIKEIDRKPGEGLRIIYESGENIKQEIEKENKSNFFSSKNSIDFYKSSYEKKFSDIKNGSIEKIDEAEKADENSQEKNISYEEFLNYIKTSNQKIYKAYNDIINYPNWIKISKSLNKISKKGSIENIVKDIYDSFLYDKNDFQDNRSGNIITDIKNIFNNHNSVNKLSKFQKLQILSLLLHNIPDQNSRRFIASQLGKLVIDENKIKNIFNISEETSQEKVGEVFDQNFGSLEFLGNTHFNFGDVLAYLGIENSIDSKQNFFHKIIGRETGDINLIQDPFEKNYNRLMEKYFQSQKANKILENDTQNFFKVYEDSKYKGLCIDWYRNIVLGMNGNSINDLYSDKPALYTDQLRKDIGISFALLRALVYKNVTVKKEDKIFLGKVYGEFLGDIETIRENIFVNYAKSTDNPTVKNNKKREKLSDLYDKSIKGDLILFGYSGQTLDELLVSLGIDGNKNSLEVKQKFLDIIFPEKEFGKSEKSDQLGEDEISDYAQRIYDSLTEKCKSEYKKLQSDKKFVRAIGLLANVSPDKNDKDKTYEPSEINNATIQEVFQQFAFLIRKDEKAYRSGRLGQEDKLYPFDVFAREIIDEGKVVFRNTDIKNLDKIKLFWLFIEKYLKGNNRRILGKMLPELVGDIDFIRDHFLERSYIKSLETLGLDIDEMIKLDDKDWIKLILKKAYEFRGESKKHNILNNIIGNRNDTTMIILNTKMDWYMFLETLEINSNQSYAQIEKQILDKFFPTKNNI